MSELFGLAGAALVGLGLYGLIVHPEPLRKILAFNLLGSGVFLLFGVIARRGAAAGLGGDPIPQALVITGIVVAFAGSALAVSTALAAARRRPARPPCIPMRRRRRPTARPDAGCRGGLHAGRLPPGAGARPAGRRPAAGDWRSAGVRPSASPWR